MSSSDEAIKKIFILTCPYTGHCNPIFGICRRLTAQNKHISICVYGEPRFKNLFESAGAVFRTYASSALEPNMRSDFNFVDMLIWGITVADKNASHLYDDVRREMPDLIIYDTTPLYSKFMLEYIVQELRRENLKLFKTVSYDTAYHMDAEYPNQFERQFLEFNIGLTTLPRLFKYFNLKRSFMKKV